jgi:nitroreductase
MENEAIKAILARRSVRRYESKPVEREKIDKILECALAAPSAHNFRPWHFIETTKREVLDALADIHPYGKMLAQAALAIIVCAEKERQNNPDVWWEQDCGAAMENILVSATALGLGSVRLGVNHQEASGVPNKIRGLLKIPPHIQVMGIASIGYGAEEKTPHQGLDPTRVHPEHW